MKTIEQSVLTAMDCTDRVILPCLPYILQDFLEISSDPDVIANLIQNCLSDINFLKILNLGYIKGAVS